jgi:hypothetical protein
MIRDMAAVLEIGRRNRNPAKALLCCRTPAAKRNLPQRRNDEAKATKALNHCY